MPMKWLCKRKSRTFLADWLVIWDQFHIIGSMVPKNIQEYQKMPLAQTIFAGSSKRASKFGEGDGTFGPGLVILFGEVRFYMLTLLRPNQLNLQLLLLQKLLQWNHQLAKVISKARTSSHDVFTV